MPICKQQHIDQQPPPHKALCISWIARNFKPGCMQGFARLQAFMRNSLVTWESSWNPGRLRTMLKASLCAS